MSSIPYNYGSYIDAKVAMTDTGHVSAGKQVQSPASAGSRGLAKTTQFTNDRTQMQMGNSPIAESMIEIRSILNRIDGVNAPVQEDEGGLPENANTLNRLKDEVEDFMGQINNTEMGNLNPTRLADELTEILNGTYDPGTDPVNDPEANDEDHIREQVGNAIELLEKGQIMPAMQMLNKAIGDDGHGVDFPNEDELTLTDDADFHEAFGVLAYPTEEIWEAEYQGRTVKLNKPTRGDVKKFKVYVKDPKTGNVKKVNFGHGGTSAKRPTMRIRKSNPAARRSFRARHNCDNPGPKTKARYWSCRKW
jgi:hypothetical protein